MSSQENAEKSALLCLPDDALISIMGYLDWRTQSILTQTHIRFLAIIHNIWRSKYKTLIIGEEDGCGMREKDFKYFIGSLQSTLNVFCMHIDNRKHFEILLNFVFPNLHDFTFHTNSFDLDFSDEDMPKMIKAFPNLRSFSPQGSFTGKFFEGFTLLENLTLTKCKSFRARYLCRILEIRRLKTLKLGVFESIEIQNTDLPMEGTWDLEVLECNGHEMTGWFLNKLMLLMNLQQLTLYSIQWTIQYGGLLQRVLMLVNRSSVKSLEIINHEFFSKRLYPVINRRTQFGTLKIVRDVIRLSVREDIIPSLERVKEIHFISCVFCEEEDFRLLMTLKSTETLALYGCRFNFNEYTFVANDIASKRSKRLNLHLDANMISSKTYPKTKMIWRTEGAHELFKLHMEIPNISYKPDAVSIYF